MSRPRRASGAQGAPAPAAAVLALASLALLAAAGCGEERGSAVEARVATYTGRASCAACHPEESAAWTGSDHDHAMEVASEASVRGDFDDARFEHGDVTTRFFRRGAEHWVSTEGADGETADFRVAYAFGWRPLQQYLLELPGGRYQALTIAWDVEAERWYPLYPDEHTPPGDELHWTSALFTWNSMCAECHSTGLEPGYDAKLDTWNTRWSEIDVSCEACHGPASEHLAWTRGERADAPHAGFAFALGGEDPAPEVEACAPCHSRRQTIASGWRPGAPFLDHFRPQLLEESLYFADGQIRDEVFEWGSWVQSRMHHEGVRCSSCHDPHGLGLRFEGNALCTQCHEAERYDERAHHHHEPGTEGASCVACHMPGRTYMGIDFRRDHGMRVPRPDLTVELGVPNACGDCHAEGAAWAAERVVEWFGPERTRGADWARQLAAGWRGAGGGLGELARDERLSAMVRASAVQAAERRGDAGPARAVLDDPDPLVRAAAARGLALLPPAERASLAAPLLADPLRHVRIEAARALAPLARALPHAARGAFAPALAELLESERLHADRPGAHLNLGALHQDLGDARAAEAAYRAALRRDPRYVPARMNLAVLLNAERRNAESEALLREALELAPELGDAHYSLGLLLAEDPARLDEAAAALSQAARLLPERPRVRYNLSIALERLERFDQARAALEEAFGLAPQDAELALALAGFFARRGQQEHARHFAAEALRLEPDHSAARELLRTLGE